MTELKNKLSSTLRPVIDRYLNDLRYNWFAGSQCEYSKGEYLNTANEWFRSTKRNNIIGWDEFPCIDVIMGCTHYIESIIIKYGWNGFQILESDYAYYGLMGKFGIPLDQLENNKPLLISLPNYKYCDLRPEWSDILIECEKKNIDIHVDMAWIVTSRDIDIDLSHPNIKSFAMSMSKYNMHWNRVGLRWSRQRTMDSVSIFNHYYSDVNAGLLNCGVYMMNNIPRDYIWDTYGEKHFEVCANHDLIPTKILHVAKLPDDDKSYGIAHLILNQ